MRLRNKLIGICVLLCARPVVAPPLTSQTTREIVTEYARSELRNNPDAVPYVRAAVPLLIKNAMVLRVSPKVISASLDCDINSLRTKSAHAIFAGAFNVYKMVYEVYGTNDVHILRDHLLAVGYGLQTALVNLPKKTDYETWKDLTNATSHP